MKNGSKLSLEVGDLFVRVDAPHIVWRVARLVPTHDGIGHVFLELRDQPSTTKLLARSALANRREFRRIGYERLDDVTPVTLFDTEQGLTTGPNT